MIATLIAAQLPEGRLDAHEPEYAPPVRRVPVRRWVIPAESLLIWSSGEPAWRPKLFATRWATITYGFPEAA